MPITPPAGYITRAQAPKHYNRSKRTLERDLEDAYAANDVDVLSHYLLVTKDGKRRPATEVTTTDVKSFMSDGMIPTWCIATPYLQRLAEADRTASSEVASDLRPTTSASQRTQHKLDNDSLSSREPSEDESLANIPLPDDVEYLKARVRILEREKEKLQAEHKAESDKLWDQIDVKDGQISSWDKISQGLTEGLATGRLTPVHSPGSPYLLTGQPPQMAVDATADPSKVQTPSADRTQAAAADTKTPGRGRQASKQDANVRRRRTSSTKKAADSKNRKQGTPTTSAQDSTPPPQQKPSRRGMVSRLVSKVW